MPTQLSHGRRFANQQMLQDIRKEVQNVTQFFTQCSIHNTLMNVAIMYQDVNHA